MASRLTVAGGVIKGPVFTNTTPQHIKMGRQRPLPPSSAAPTTVTYTEPGSTHKAGHHSVLPCVASRQHNPAALSLPRHHHDFTVWNRKYFNPPTPHPLHQLKGMPLNGC